MQIQQGFGQDVGSGDVGLFSPILFFVGVLGIGGFLYWKKKKKVRANISPSVLTVRNVIAEIEADDDEDLEEELDFEEELDMG